MVLAFTAGLLSTSNEQTLSKAMIKSLCQKRAFKNESLSRQFLLMRILEESKHYEDKDMQKYIRLYQKKALSIFSIEQETAVGSSLQQWVYYLRMCPKVLHQTQVISILEKNKDTLYQEWLSGYNKPKKRLKHLFYTIILFQLNSSSTLAGLKRLISDRKQSDQTCLCRIPKRPHRRGCAGRQTGRPRRAHL